MKSQYPILVLLFCFIIPNAAQNFYLDENGVTIKCENCQPGDTGTVNGILYEAVDRKLLEQKISDTADLTVLCTSLITEMDSLFYGMKDFNQAIQLAPNYADPYVSRAFVYSLLGKSDLAQADAKKASELGDNYANIMFEALDMYLE